MKRCLLSLCAALVLASCGKVDPAQVSRGTFEGNVHLVWIRGGEDDPLGDGVFAYLPTGNDKLVFNRGAGKWRSEGSEVIVPEAFYTDGGSVPRAFQSLNGFNAWAYGPAYVIHDWIFVARKCLNDKDITPHLITDEMRKVGNMEFEESAYVMAETITSLAGAGLGPNNDNANLIASVTAGPRTRVLWKQKGACEKSLVSQAKLDELMQAAQTNEALRDEIAPQALANKRTGAGPAPAASVEYVEPPTEFTLSDGSTAVFLGAIPMGSR
ncbi:DUF1353 domain-containing protein [Pacificibacter sp. AS14]|uniref:DUF1353 domain-containing protein n=1 Tax=Pacificibacter sp. AS14 TaxID=3135785 RepID=UPI0031754749